MMVYKINTMDVIQQHGTHLKTKGTRMLPRDLAYYFTK